MVTSNHNYAECISFYYIEKDNFNKLLDQVKVISQSEYDEEAQDGFQSLVNFWNEKGRKRFNAKLASNKIRIKHL
tara:strand:- start:4380 stop:4604 length:225 start_codon:yes stop_codon:yes gene_type:complete